MTSITYENQNGRKINGNRMWGIDVRLDGKIVGDIRQVAGGYVYKPTGRKPGDVYATVPDLKRDLEAE
jgi:hypothetical protein